ncbi:MAG: hypothetical protein ACSHYA_20355 [Opitutaceae bacterium]
MKKVNPIIPIGLSIILPVIGGFLGAAKRLGGIEKENLSWILIWSLPVSIISALIVAFLCSLRDPENTKNDLIGVLTFATLLIGFILSIQLLDQACGI